MLYLIVTLFSIASADYRCICNYNIEKAVYSSASQQNQPLGYLYEFDCKPVVSQTAEVPDWIVIAFEHQKGYVFKDQSTRLEICLGEPASIDLLPTAVSLINQTSLTTVDVKTNSTGTQTTSQRPYTSPTVLKTTQTTQTVRTTTEAVLVCPPTVQQSAQQVSSLLLFNDKDQKCYEFVTHPRNWENAENECKKNGGHLITIRDSISEELVYKYVKSYGRAAWIGLHDRNKEESFEWISGEPVVYLNWHTGRKDENLHEREDCVAMGPHTGTWEDLDCLIRYAYICEFDAVYGSSNDTQLQISTPSGTKAYTDGNTKLCPQSSQAASLNDSTILGQYGSSCYELISDIRVNWKHGESICTKRGGHLAHVSNADEQGFVQYFLNRYSPEHAVWIGLHDTKVEDLFEWTSGNSVSYENWVPAHVGNFGNRNTEDCVAFIPYKNGQWDDISCGDSTVNSTDVGEIHPIICQYDLPPSEIVG